MSNVSINVSVREGTFVYLGPKEDEDDTARWQFLRFMPDGSVRGGRTPHRWKKLLKKDKTKHGKNAKQAKG